MRPYILAETNWKAIRDLQVDVAVLPWGATEAHNYHLPYATDNIEGEAIAAEAARMAWEKGTRAVVLPAVPFGVNTGQADIRLNINLNPSTQLAILRDIIEVLDRQGINRFLVLNAHGGNDFKPILRELGLKFPEMFLVTTSFFNISDRNSYFRASGDHADEMETSLLLHLRPDLVQPLKEAGLGEERKSRITGIREGWAWSERKWSEVTSDTGIGNPAEATAEKGKLFFGNVCQKLADLLVEFSQVNPKNRYH